MSENRQALRPVDVANWLKQNPTVDGRPTRLRDAYAATGWPKTEARLKVSTGNLSNNRSALQLKRLGDNGATRRNFHLQIRPPINAEERRLNREQNRSRTELNRQYGKREFAIDHLFPLDALGEAVMGQGPRLRSRTIKELEQIFGPVGDRHGNRQIVSNETNEQRRQASAKNPTPKKPKLKAPDHITALRSRFASIIDSRDNVKERLRRGVLDILPEGPVRNTAQLLTAGNQFDLLIEAGDMAYENENIANLMEQANTFTDNLIDKGLNEIEYFGKQTIRNGRQLYRDQLRRRGS